jgi:hypothetical protein
LRVRFSKLSLALLLTGAGLILLTAGCGDGGGSTQLRVVNASPDAPALDFRYDGKAIATNVAYQQFSSYAKVASGNRKVEVAPTGTATDAINRKASFVQSTFYTLIAGDKLASIAPLLFIDNLAAPASGSIKVRFINASPSAPDVDVYVGPVGSAPTGTPAAANLTFTTATGYLTLPAGTYEIFITPTGTKQVLIDSGPLTLTAGQIRTAVALDAPGGGSPFVAIVLPDLN